MQPIAFLAPGVAVTGALSAADLAGIAAQGFRTVISNRPDGEEPGQMSRAEEAVHAWRAGLAFRHAPAAKHEVLDERAINRMEDALWDAQGPVLLHCKSGQRSAILWAAARARHEPVDQVMAALREAGFDLDALRDEIESPALKLTECVGCPQVA